MRSASARPSPRSRRSDRHPMSRIRPRSPICASCAWTPRFAWSRGTWKEPSGRWACRRAAAPRCGCGTGARSRPAPEPAAADCGAYGAPPGCMRPGRPSTRLRERPLAPHPVLLPQLVGEELPRLADVLARIAGIVGRAHVGTELPGAGAQHALGEAAARLHAQVVECLRIERAGLVPCMVPLEAAALVVAGLFMDQPGRNEVDVG